MIRPHVPCKRGVSRGEGGEGEGRRVEVGVGGDYIHDYLRHEGVARNRGEGEEARGGGGKSAGNSRRRQDGRCREVSGGVRGHRTQGGRRREGCGCARVTLHNPLPASVDSVGRRRGTHSTHSTHSTHLEQRAAHHTQHARQRRLLRTARAQQVAHTNGGCAQWAAAVVAAAQQSV